MVINKGEVFSSSDFRMVNNRSTRSDARNNELNRGSLYACVFVLYMCAFCIHILYLFNSILNCMYAQISIGSSEYILIIFEIARQIRNRNRKKKNKQQNVQYRQA